MLRQIEMLKQDFAIASHKAMHGGAFELDGLKLAIPKSVKRQIKYQLITGEYEKNEFALATDWLPTDLPVIELGGCLGVLSAHLRRLIDSDQKLTIVEANPTLIDTCRANACRPSPDSPTEIICAAVAYDVEVVSFHLNRNSHTSRVADGAAVANHESPAVTLRKLVETELPPESEFTLVCDIEGNEYEVFKNDLEVLQRCRLAIVETHPGLFADDPDWMPRFNKLLADAGFRTVASSEHVVVLARI